MPILPTLVFFVAGLTVLYSVHSLIGGFGFWSLGLMAVLLLIPLSLVVPRMHIFAKGLCALAAAVSSLFVAMSLIGSTIGSGMSAEFKPLFFSLVVLAVAGTFVCFIEPKRRPEQADDVDS